MRRPDGLPTIDARSKETKPSANFLTTSLHGAPWSAMAISNMIETPTETMKQSAEAGIIRQLQLRRRH